MPGSTPRIERLVPVPQMSLAGFTRFSEINTAKYPSQALRDAFTAGRIPVGDLPEIIANIWTRDDSSASGISEENWLKVLRQVGFFSWPPLLVRGADGTAVPLRPTSTLTLYRGSTADRMRRMSWSFDRAMAEELGRRHSPYGTAALYQSVVAPDMILAYLERRGDGGWTIVVDPTGLTAIEKLEDIRQRTTPRT
jgi:hypothetical protein